MPSIHVKDELAARYVKATGDTADFKSFVNHVVGEAVKREEEKTEFVKKRRGK